MDFAHFSVYNGDSRVKNANIESKAIMARAKRHYIPEQIWHLTQRCHKREFLLKLVMDRRKWVQWLFEAKKRYGLVILNYAVTSNHIHLLVLDEEGRDVIPESIKLVAGRTAQEYNLRKNRKGAFWEDRYHATGIESERHLLSFMLNLYCILFLGTFLYLIITYRRYLRTAYLKDLIKHFSEQKTFSHLEKYYYTPVILLLVLIGYYYADFAAIISFWKYWKHKWL